jgi:hypothetical protein
MSRLGLLAPDRNACHGLPLRREFLRSQHPIREALSLIPTYAI